MEKRIQTFVKTKQSKKRALMFRFVLHRHFLRGPTFRSSFPSFWALRLGDLVFSERSIHFFSSLYLGLKFFFIFTNHQPYKVHHPYKVQHGLFLLWSLFLNPPSWRNLSLWCLRETLANSIVWLSNTHSSGGEHTCFPSVAFRVAHSLERSPLNRKGTWKGFMFALIWNLLQRIMRTVSASQAAFRSPGRGAKFYITSVKLRWEWASPFTFICVREEELTLNYTAECDKLELGSYLQFHCRENYTLRLALRLGHG